MRAVYRRILLGWVLLVLLIGCEQGPKVPVTFRIPRGGFPSFLETPWPSDLLLREVSGQTQLDLRTFPNPTGSATLDEYLEIISASPGYSSSAALFFHVEGGVDPASLPATGWDSVQPSSSLFLVELERPERRIPIEWQLYEDGNSFLPPGSVAVLPLLGAVVRGPAALVMTDDAKSPSGERLGPSDDLYALLTCELPDDLSAPPDCTPYRRLVQALGLPPERIALAQIFTPYEATSALRKAYAWLVEQPPPPVLEIQLQSRGQYSLFDVYEGVVTLQQFQAGSPPYLQYDGESGGFILDERGTPIPQRTEDVRFVLTVPRGDAPAGGFPVAINGHGTGGDLYSGIGEGEQSEAHQLARAGYAMIAASEPLHYTREGYREGDEALATFNFLNPLAGRDNWRQSALEKVQLVTLARNLSLSPAITGGPRVYLNPNKVAYFGHSQGGITGALFLGVEERIEGAFLSGAGAGFAPSLIEKTKPIEIASVLRTLLSLPDDEPIDRFHPVPALMQIFVEPSDPLNYGRLWRARERGRTPHLVATSGLKDEYTPKRSHAALAGAFGLPIVGPVAERWEVLDVLGLLPMPAPIGGNLRTARGEPLTGGILQYPSDGHFAVYYNEHGQDAFYTFFDTLREGVPLAGAR